MDRRRFLIASSLGALGAATGWEAASRAVSSATVDDGFDAGPVRHLLPSATHERIRLKASFEAPRPAPPLLDVDGSRVPGRRTDTAGRFFLFDVEGLVADREHTLRLRDADGTAMTDPWPLRTLPGPDAPTEHVRLLCYTCAGGPEYIPSPTMGSAYLPLAARRRLLARGLRERPDVVVANGDHVYWDLRGDNGWALGSSPQARWRTGLFDRSLPVLGTVNEGVMTRAFDPQIADLYGTLLRSTPAVFVQDDHDYTENDVLYADGTGTFPPDRFMRDVAAATQRLYEPEFLPAVGMPDTLLGRERVGRHHGTLRVGRLLEALAYDCRQELTTGADGRFLAPATEGWLDARLRTSDATWVAQVPSSPFVWTAGRWIEWYPDTKGEDGQLHADRNKPGWSPGWQRQHDRLLAAAGARGGTPPLMLCGDIHASGAARLLGAGAVSLVDQPALALLVGTLGTGTGFQSFALGVPPQPSATLQVDQLMAATEHNGFTILDVTADAVTARLFVWSPADGVDAIEQLRPVHEVTVGRGTA